jgi:hypothetical protein
VQILAADERAAQVAAAAQNLIPAADPAAEVTAESDAETVAEFLKQFTAGPADAEVVEVAQPFWLDRPCPPWCGFATNRLVHRINDARGDRLHMMADVLTMPLTRHDAIATEHKPMTVAGEMVMVGKAWKPNHARLELVQNVEHAEPEVWLARDDGDAFTLTVGEARALAELLVKIADLADGHWQVAP